MQHRITSVRCCAVPCCLANQSNDYFCYVFLPRARLFLPRFLRVVLRDPTRSLFEGARAFMRLCTLFSLGAVSFLCAACILANKTENGRRSIMSEQDPRLAGDSKLPPRQRGSTTARRSSSRRSTQRKRGGDSAANSPAPRRIWVGLYINLGRA